MTYDGLDRVSSSHLAADGWRGDPACVAQCDIQPIAFDPVATVSAVNVGAFDGCAGEFSDLVDLRGQGMAVVGATRQGLSTQYKLSALAALVGCGD